MVTVLLVMKRQPGRVSLGTRHSSYARPVLCICHVYFPAVMLLRALLMWAVVVIILLYFWHCAR